MDDGLNIQLFNWLHAGAGNRPVPDFLSVIGAEITPYLVIVCMAVFWFSTDRQGKRVLLEGAAVVTLGLLLNQLITVFYYHPRPYMLHLCQPLIPHAPETSFPSDHATLLFGASFALLFRRGWWKQGLLFLILAVIGSWGRIYTGLHFPFDIMGSLVVALLCTVLIALLREVLTPLYDRLIRIISLIESALPIKKTKNNFKEKLK
ncbi:undecaprenyl-diphosphatase BcrC [Desulfolithobacter dissulfuricans]|uniref:Undecaprenyl-diphosphatase BcrC n=1 Tax=Desulfolithobacter dissulfuricans TaxID=2795293 RepID=A0A915U107_9BACT|nr:undecaprenyl-diphosphatase [Desulfolithobacter dissulfuricans]BCO09496.1 undecaprenyl-diphosphatase BcrC [Desulfolithobacter dissulfuricans]